MYPIDRRLAQKALPHLRPRLSTPCASTFCAPLPRTPCAAASSSPPSEGALSDPSGSRALKLAQRDLLAEKTEAGGARGRAKSDRGRGGPVRRPCAGRARHQQRRDRPVRRARRPRSPCGPPCAWEEEAGAVVRDVSKPALARVAGLPDSPGFDLLAELPNGRVRRIEVKGRWDHGGVHVTGYEWTQARHLADSYWLYELGTARRPSRPWSASETRSPSCSPASASRPPTRSPPSP